MTLSETGNNMRAKRAADHFKGLNGAKRLNCAQSVAGVFLDKGLLTENEFSGLASCGFGRAPNGYCGSLFASLTLMEKIDAGKIDGLKDEFMAYAGSLNCKEIRAARKATCLQTVVKSVELVERLAS